MLYHIHHSGNYQKLPLQVELIGVDHLQEPIQRPHGFPAFQWLFCTKGKGEFINNGQKAILANGQGLLIYPSIPHSYKALSKDWTLQIIAFKGNACKEILQSLNMLESGVYYFSDAKIINTHTQNMLNILDNDTTPKILRESELSKACYSMLLDLEPCIKHINDTTQMTENELILKLTDYMESNYTQPVTLTDLSEYINLSKEYMCSLFKDVTGQTIMQYLKTVRIGRAKILLMQYPEKHVSEIAHLCGFEDAGYFGRVFKKMVGCTPDYFRR